MRACQGGVLLYPVYALLFADAGVSAAGISTLFVVWSVVAFVVEVPSGAWADSWSRRRLYAIGAFLTASGYASWLVWPAYPGFALGFVLWGLGGALASGSIEALIYDELAADGAAGRYAAVAGRGGTVEILAMLSATVLAAPAYAWGGYRLVGAASVVVTAAGGLVALGFVEAPRRQTSDEWGGAAGYLRTIRAGLRDVTRSRRVAWAVAVAALVPGFTALDEYLPLVSRAAGAPTVAVPLLFALPSLAMAGGSALAGRFATIGRGRLGGAVGVAAALLAAGALSGHPAGMVPIAVAFGVLQFAIVITETRLQEAISGRARATVLSVAGFVSEVVAVLVYTLFALGAHVAAVPLLFAACGIPLLATAAAIARRTPV
ncbi:MFS transporter [Mangrovihabitans endophyticus]|uniref:MFS transporter n=1 Tax=Mangrovihabitans endophyticus TaxID=1751298 RepID=A0A8J3C048_9ACTN|nr:MFS transporter [Mangrovihabitans endophyticus]GGK96164.1 MFS transporter [Mangrovihabitans endophyticus]